MKRVLSYDDLANLSLPAPNAVDWTVVIPAAGKGSRLGFEGPKAIYPVHERPLASWVMDVFQNHCKSFVIITPTSGRLRIEKVLTKEFPNTELIFVEQAVASGTAEAVLLSEGSVQTTHVLVAWADHATIKKETAEWVMKIHASRPDATLTLATSWRKKPYISIRRNAQGQILSVDQAREGNKIAMVGENDCGFFAFARRSLFPILQEAERSHGETTGESNLLPLFPHFEGSGDEVVSLRIGTEEETLGINTPDEALQVTAILEKERCLTKPLKATG